MSESAGRIGRGYIFVSAFLSTALVLIIYVVLVIESLDAVTTAGSGLFTTEWNPARMKFGMIPMIYGSVMVTAIALLIAVPLGLSTAVFTSEILPPGYRYYLKSALELLAGIPSIVYGLIGVAVLSVFIESVFDLSTGRTILTGGILLGIMVLPTIITLCDDAMKNVSVKYREAAKGVGLYRFEVLRRVVFPQAKSNITAAVLLALGRALGETMAVMLVIGSIDRIPSNPLNVLVPGQTITSKLGREIPEAVFGSLHFSAMIFTGLVLLVIVSMITTAVLVYYHDPENRAYE